MGNRIYWPSVCVMLVMQLFACGGSSSSTMPNGNGATLLSIAVTPTNPGIVLGTTQQFTATGTYADNTTQDLTTSVTWGSSSTGVATISNVAGSNGLATSVSPGPTTITATLGSIHDTSTLTVTPADTNPPALLSASPADNATTVPVNTAIAVTFSETIDPTSISSVVFLVKNSNGKALSGTVSVNAAEATFVPRYDLSYGAVYTVTINAGVKDLAGNPTTTSSQWSFTTLSPPLDPQFGTNGIVTTTVGTGGSNIANALRIQSDGKIVAAGSAFNYLYNVDNFAIARYDSNGILDASFGTGGMKMIQKSVQTTANAITFQTDGKMLVYGDFFNMLARLQQNGSLDSSFGTAGIVNTQIGSIAANDRAKAVALQSDGKIVAVGSAYTNSTTDFAVSRITTTGLLDTSFGNGGNVTTPIGPFDDWATATAIQTDDKIVVAGFSQDGISDRNFTLVRYNADGSLDQNFGTGGKVVTDISGQSRDDFANAIALQPDGKIVVAGYENIDHYMFVLARYNANGTIDTSFGDNGKATASIGPFSIAYSVAICPNGKIVAAGFALPDQNDFCDSAVVRFNPNGALDTSFGSDGIVTTAVSPYDDEAHGVACQQDNKIVITGYAYNGTNNEFMLVRYSQQ